MIKELIKKIVMFLLRVEERLILRKYKPKIAAVTGTVGKTSTKDAIVSVLSAEFFTRGSEKSYNSEFGVPLTVIGVKSAWSSLLKWLLVLFKGLRLLIAKYDYPQWLVLEMGVDRPGDMEKLTSWIKPNVVVITRLGDVPVHIEYFKSPEELMKEKTKLAKIVREGDYVVLNGDDKQVLEVKNKVKANVLTYGFSEENDLTASNYHIVCKEPEDSARLGGVPEGITFKVDYKGSIVPIRLFGVFGKQAVYTALAALAAGSAVGLNLIEMAESLSRFKPPPGRLRLLGGIKNSFILDDSYNSSPVAVESAVEVLRDIPAKRKIAVVGDMLELGKYTIDEHKKVGGMLKGAVDLIFTVGPRSKFTAEGAREAGFNPKNIFEFSTSDEAKKKIQEKIKEGDLILVKGSQGMRMEKIVEEIMAHPEKKEQLLVRQEKEWLNR
ncbi:MAG TPA: UDP-N-acetylmuramoyl-tripeptide--D-alanyl-D-alanine ligase [Candidatus Campbellbacteria bacterium]|nr:UDP-N-acetylmuramoyl-tripeptide--D-alanyl-D-alanine ligase [Candidatus Campbellbacteria bacterium]